MNLFMREFRLIPVVLFATMTLLALKIGGLIFSGGYILASPRIALANERPEPVARPDAKRSWGQDVCGFPALTGGVNSPPPGEKEGEGGKGDAAKPAAGAAP